MSNMRDIAKHNAAGEAGRAFADKFYRKGVVGDSRGLFDAVDPEFRAEWDGWVRKNLEETKVDMVFE